MSSRMMAGLALGACSALAWPAGGAHAAESYTVTATTSLSLDGEAVVQQWSASCVSQDAAPDAVITPGGKNLRFLAAPDQAAAVGVDELSYAIDNEAGAVYRYDGVVGARVFARLSVRCGSADVFDEVVVDSLPLVVPPALDPPSSVQRNDTLLPIAGGVIPVGVEVELVGLSVLGHPRGDELLTFSISGPGVDVSGALSADEVGASGRAALSPRFTANELGEVVVNAALLDAAARPLFFTVVPDDDGFEPGDDLPLAEPALGCHSAPTGGAALMIMASLLLRRRTR